VQHLVPDPLTRLVECGGAVVLSGAGLSTESGIPDYRGPTGSLRRHTPMTFQSFLADPLARHRYWARSYLGWAQLASAEPNEGHRAVSGLQAAGLLAGIVTQNVDGLQQAAGASGVVELHGGLNRVVCLHCGARSSRAVVDALLRAANPTFSARASAFNPDGDADLPEAELDRFVMVDCPLCGAGPLKPDVVFFGESVPRDRVELCYELVDGARSLLVLGSSLTVYSGYRFALRAAKRGTPVAIVNQGSTRADALAAVLVDAPLGRVLPAVVEALGLNRRAPAQPVAQV